MALNKILPFLNLFSRYTLFLCLLVASTNIWGSHAIHHDSVPALMDMVVGDTSMFDLLPANDNNTSKIRKGMAATEACINVHLENANYAGSNWQPTYGSISPTGLYEMNWQQGDKIVSIVFIVNKNNTSEYQYRYNNNILGPPPGTYTIYSGLQLTANRGKVLGYLKETSGYDSNYIYSAVNTGSGCDYAITSGTITIKESTDGPYIVIDGYAGYQVCATGWHQTSVYYNYDDVCSSVGTDGNLIKIPLTTQLKWHDNTKAATGWESVSMEGNGNGNDNKNYDARICINTTTPTGTFPYSSLDLSCTSLTQGGNNIPFTNATVKITSSTAKVYEVEATFTGADGKTYVVTATYEDCVRGQSSAEQGSWANFKHSTSTDVIQFGTYQPDPDDWYWTDRNFFTIKAWNTARNSNNYVQLYFWMEQSNAYTYADGTGPKPGTYSVPAVQLKEVIMSAYESYYYWYLPESAHNTSVAGYLYSSLAYSEGWGIDGSGIAPMSSAGVYRNPSTGKISTYTGDWSKFNNGSVVVSVGKDGNIYIKIYNSSGQLVVTIGEPILTSPTAYLVETYVNGQGSVTKNPEECFYEQGTTLTLTPTPEDGWYFTCWTGDCAGNITDNHDGTYTYTVPSKDCSVTANFAQRAEVTDIIDTCSNELPFTWREWNKGGKVITSIAQNGIKDTVKTGERIDSIVTLQLRIHPAYTTYIKDERTLCAEEMKTFTWEGETFTQYVHIKDTAKVDIKKDLQTTFGCDSLVNLLLTIVPIDTIHSKKTVCSSELPITWQGKKIWGRVDDDDTIHVYQHGAEGCYSVVQLDLTVHQSDTTLDHKQVCSFPYEWTPPTWTSSITIRNMEEVATEGKVTDINQYGCDSIVQLVVHMLPTTTMPDTNAVVCQAEQEYFIWPGHEHLGQLTESKTYRDTARYKESGCDSAYFTLNLRFVVPQTETTELAHICEGETYNWEKHPKYQGLTEGGIYKDTLLSQAGCDSLYSTLNLIKHIAKDSIERDTACSNEIGYEWHGKWIEFSEDEDYESFDTLRYNGCDSIRFKLLLHVFPVIQDFQSISGCYPSFDWTDPWGDTHTFTYPTDYEEIQHEEEGSNKRCYSTIWLDISYKRPSASTFDTTLCSNDFPFIWHGRTIQSAADNGKTDTLINAVGCDSVVTLNMTLHPTYSVTDPVVKCDNELPFTWNGETIASAADDGKQVTLPTIHGCDSVVTLALTIHPTYDVEDPISKCESGLPFTWNGETIASAADDGKQVTLPTIHGCDSLVTLRLSIVSTLYATDPVVKCDNELPFTWNGETISSAADDGKQVTLSSSAGCDSIVTLALTIHKSYTLTDGATICDKELPYIWEGETFTAGGSKTKNLYTTLGCDSIVTFTLVVNASTKSEASKTIQQYELPYTWDGIVFKNAADTTIVLPGGNVKGCDSTVIRHLTVNTCYDLRASMTLDVVCANQKEMNATLLVSQGEVASYSLHYKTQDPNGHFEDIIDEPVYGTSPYRIAIPFAEQTDTLRYIRPNDYEVEVTLTDNCDRDSSFSLNMKVLYPSWLIVQKWDDVLALRNANYNGGYTFSQIAWYNEGTRITGHGVNNSYLYTDSKNGETLRFGTAYWAELTRADDGKTICTCTKVPQKSQPEVQPKRIQIHVRNSGHQIDLTTDLNGSYTLYDITGKMLQTGKFGSQYNANTILIDKSCTTGSYLLLFQSDDGDTQMEKIGVY